MTANGFPVARRCRRRDERPPHLDRLAEVESAESFRQDSDNREHLPIGGERCATMDGLAARLRVQKPWPMTTTGGAEAAVSAGVSKRPSAGPTPSSAKYRR